MSYVFGSLQPGMAILWGCASSKLQYTIRSRIDSVMPTVYLFTRCLRTTNSHQYLNTIDLRYPKNLRGPPEIHITYAILT